MVNESKLTKFTELLDDKQLIAILRAEKFDAGFSETVDFGSMGIFYPSPITTFNVKRRVV